MPGQRLKISRTRFIKAYWITFRIIWRYLRLLMWRRFYSAERTNLLYESAHDKTARELVQALLELKGLYIKIGQTLSVLGNFLPERFATGLASLQDAVPPHTFAEMEPRFISDFGKPATELFKSIEEIPIASASLGQVHIAYSHDGRKLAVKLQYPNIEKITERDLKTIRNIVACIHFFFPGYNLKTVVDEAAHIIVRELDYRQEAKNIALIASHFKDRSDILFPEVISELSSQKVLTTTFMEGAKVTDVGKLPQAIDKSDLARRIINFYCKQIFEDGVYHADPHPGNIIISEQGQICMVDFGAIATVSPTMRKGLTLFVEGIIKRDTRILSEAIKMMGFVAKNDDSETLDKVVEYFYSKITSIRIQSFKNLDISQFQQLSDLIELKRMNISFRELTTLFAIPREWILLERTMLLLMGLTANLDEHLNPVEIVVPYVEKFILGDQKNLTEWLLGASKDLILSYVSLPTDLQKTLKKINAGEFKIQTPGINRELSRIRRALVGFGMVIVSCTFGALSVMLYQTGNGESAFRFEMGSFAFALLFLFVLLRR